MHKLRGLNSQRPHMKTEISYQFESSQVANRFLHELKNWSVNDVKTRLFMGEIA